MRKLSVSLQLPVDTTATTIMSSPQNLRKTFMRNWFAVEVGYPCASVGLCADSFLVRPFLCEWSVLWIWKDLTFAFSYVIIGGVVLGAGWYLGRLAMGPSSESILVVVPSEHFTDPSF